MSLDPFQAALLEVQLEDARKGPCTLCGTLPPATVGIWTPTPAVCRRIGAPEGKVRVVVYVLCRTCSGLPRRQIAARVERQVLEDLQAAPPGGPS